MGIPALVSNLLRKNKNIKREYLKTERLPQYNVLAVDFNCFIHTYLKADNPIGSVVAGLHDLLQRIQANYVYIAFDGLVPYAKIVQQRYRRMRKSDISSTFDKNQISPGTPYMKFLARMLKFVYPQIIISGTEEAGEGEHKIFTWVRTLPEIERKEICIYGLDADLVLISIAQREVGNITLLREQDDEISTFSINAICQDLPVDPDVFVQMSVMAFGNDFMPTIAMFSLREGGFNRALHFVEQKSFMEAVAQEQSILMTKQMPYTEEQVGVKLFDGVLDWEKITYAFWKTYAWTLHYFKTSEVLDWHWYYPYPEAPLMKTLNENPIVYDFEWIYKQPQYTIEDQLKFILPAVSLPKELTQKFEDEFYDEDSGDMRELWMKRFNWETDPFVSLPWNPSENLTRVDELNF